MCGTRLFIFLGNFWGYVTGRRKSSCIQRQLGYQGPRKPWARKWRYRIFSRKPSFFGNRESSTTRGSWARICASRIPRNQSTQKEICLPPIYVHIAKRFTFPLPNNKFNTRVEPKFDDFFHSTSVMHTLNVSIDWVSVQHLKTSLDPIENTNSIYATLGAEVKIVRILIPRSGHYILNYALFIKGKKVLDIHIIQKKTWEFLRILETFGRKRFWH